MANGFERYKEDAAGCVSGRNGAGGSVERVVFAGGTVLSEGRQRTPSGGHRAHATDLLFAAVVQSVGPLRGRSAVRLSADAALRADRSWQRTGAGRDDGL